MREAARRGARALLLLIAGWLAAAPAFALQPPNVVQLFSNNRLLPANGWADGIGQVNRAVSQLLPRDAAPPGSRVVPAAVHGVAEVDAGARASNPSIAAPSNPASRAGESSR